MRAARSPAFLAPSIATQATGTPGGICTAESRASSPPRLLPRIGTPITGRSVWAAATPGSAADIPAPAISTRRPRIRAAWQYSRTFSGSRWALITRTSYRIPASCSAVPAGCILGLSFLEPMMIPTRGASTSISSNAASTSGIGSSFAGVATSVSVLGSRCISTVVSSPLLSARDRGHGPLSDVGPHLLAAEINHPRGLVRALAGGRRPGPAARSRSARARRRSPALPNPGRARFRRG